MKRVKIAELKSQLSRHLRAVERGAEIEITDRNRPIARIVPIRAADAASVIMPAEATVVALRAKRPRPARWRQSSRWVASELIRLECLRTIDRARNQLGLANGVVADRRGLLHDNLRAFDRVRLDGAVLERAAEPFPTALATLDALHLASALLARRTIPELRMATHDVGLGIAARAMGFEVVGIRGLA